MPPLEDPSCAPPTSPLHRAAPPVGKAAPARRPATASAVTRANRGGGDDDDAPRPLGRKTRRFRLGDAWAGPARASE